MHANGRRYGFEMDVVKGARRVRGMGRRGAAAEFAEQVESEPEEEAAEGFAEPGAHFFFGKDGSGKEMVGGGLGNVVFVDFCNGSKEMYNGRASAREECTIYKAGKLSNANSPNGGKRNNINLPTVQKPPMRKTEAGT